MSKLTSLIRRAPKRLTAALTMVAAAIIVPAIVFAWGPTRQTYTVENPANHVTFNSITNNPNIGDERNFVGIREVGSSNVWHDTMNVQDGKEYYVRMYVHNNAAENLNKVAENVTAKVNLPTTTAKSIQVDGFINSSNATPTEVYDSATFTSNTDFNLAYVSGSLKYENNVFGSAGAALPESIFTSAGAKLGYDKLDGKIPGCFKYAGYVSFKVKPQVAKSLNFNLTKMVSKKGENKWVESYKAQPNEEVDFLLSYQNVGTAQNDNVTFRDTLPTGLTYVNGSTTWNNASQKNVKAGDTLTNAGVNVGSYATKANAWVVFSAKVADTPKLACGTNTLVNKGTVSTGGYIKEDTATVTVDKKCEPPVAKYVCKSLAVRKFTENTVRFTTDYSVENATFKNITYVIRNESGTVVDRKVTTERTIDYTQNTAGKYSVEALVTVTVNGQDKTAPGINCKGNFEIEKKVVAKYTCNALDVKSISRTEFRFSTAYTVENATFKGITYTVRDASGKVVDTINATTNSSTYTQKQAGAYTVQATVSFTVNGETKTATSDKCKDEFKVKDLPKEITVCELATKKIVTIKESEFNTSKYSKNLDDCKETPKTIEVCEIATKTTVTINEKDFDASKHTKDLSKCETPVTPPELPTTGAGENIVAVIGLGAMIASIAYYAASRRALNQ